MIWIGGLVTTSGAGMAVPDWPNTYGYNLFLYPWETWVYGPWKLFIEHGHRLLGTVVGMITIGFLLSTWICQRRAAVRWLGLAALVGVLLQGALGGMRVLANEITLAQIHGCVGPAFFASAVALAVVTSRQWREAEPPTAAGVSTIERLAFVTTFLAMLQIVLGSQLRHLPAGARPGDFRLALFFHLFVAAGLWAHILMLAFRVLRSFRQQRWIARPGWGLSLLVGLQICLGFGTWITKYGFPGWLSGFDFAAQFRPTADAPWQLSIATAHVAMGAMMLATSLLLALRAMRLASLSTPGSLSTPASRGGEVKKSVTGPMLLMEAAR